MSALAVCCSRRSVRDRARRLGQPDEIGRLIALLFEAKTPFLTGAIIYADGAQGISL